MTWLMAGGGIIVMVIIWLLSSREPRGDARILRDVDETLAGLPPELSTQISLLIQQQRPLEAVKRLRQETGASLVVCKRIVERLAGPG